MKKIEFLAIYNLKWTMDNGLKPFIVNCSLSISNYCSLHDFLYQLILAVDKLFKRNGGFSTDDTIY